jgi:hypothetical protein
MLASIITWLLQGWLSRWALTAEGEIKAGWKWATSSAVHALAIALAVSAAGNWLLWQRGDRYRDRLAAVAKVQHQAGQDQATVNHEPARKSAEIARQSDAQAPAYYADVRRAADSHRVRGPACPPVAADMPGTDRAAPVDDRSPAVADMVSRPRAEDDLIVAAAGRAAQMHADALDLIATGAAVPSDQQNQAE